MIRRPSRAFVSAVTLAFAFAAELAAQPAAVAEPERWTAMTTTAMAITGDVRFTPSSIRFQNGVALRLTPLARLNGFPAKAPMEFYRVDSAANPPLLHGNRLCGRKPVTYLVVSHARTPAADVELSAYNGARAPQNEGQNLCATFGYKRVPSAR